MNIFPVTSLSTFPWTKMCVPGLMIVHLSSFKFHILQITNWLRKYQLNKTGIQRKLSDSHGEHETCTCYISCQTRDRIMRNIVRMGKKNHLTHCGWSLTHWGRDKMDAISQTTFSSAFSWMKIFQLRLKFHWSLFPRVQSTIFQHWLR